MRRGEGLAGWLWLMVLSGVRVCWAALAIEFAERLVYLGRKSQQHLHLCWLLSSAVRNKAVHVSISSGVRLTS